MKRYLLSNNYHSHFWSLICRDVWRWSKNHNSRSFVYSLQFAQCGASGGGVLHLRTFSSPAGATATLQEEEASAVDVEQQQQQQPYTGKETLKQEPVHLASRKRLDVAIVGLPNAGKSQIINILSQDTVSAVSRKRHTTRNTSVLGARTVITDLPQGDKEGTQLVFVDTPGFLQYKKARSEKLQRQLMIGAGSAMRHVDFTLIVVDAARTLENVEYKETLAALIMQSLQIDGRREWSDTLIDRVKPDPPTDKDPPIVTQAKFAFVLNKVDLVHPKDLLLDKASILYGIAQCCIQYNMGVQRGLITEPFTLERGEAAQKKYALKEAGRLALAKQLPTFFYADSRKEEGTDEILQFLLCLATPTVNEWPIESDQSTNLTQLERIQEVIREKVYRCLHREVPYQIEQTNELFRITVDETTGQSTAMIHQTLVVYTKSHAQLVHGTGGRTLANIREKATRDLQAVLNCPIVHLHLHVKLITSKNHGR